MTTPNIVALIFFGVLPVIAGWVLLSGYDQPKVNTPKPFNIDDSRYVPNGATVNGPGAPLGQPIDGNPNTVGGGGAGIVRSGTMSQIEQPSYLKLYCRIKDHPLKKCYAVVDSTRGYLEVTIEDDQ